LKDGEINRAMIERELVAALKEDHTYHVTDEAKKKVYLAVHLST
jgi:hypothetical protein